MKYEAVIFDMDGVLIDSEPAYVVAVRELMQFLRVEITKEQRVSMVGRSGVQIGRLIKEWFPALPYRPLEITALYGGRLLTALRRDVKDLIPGVEGWIDRLRGMGVKTAVASSSTAPMVAHVVETFGLREKMDAVLCGADATASKPDPEIFLKAAERMGVFPGCCLVLEDSQNGVYAARAAGMDCGAFTGAQALELRVEITGADKYFTAYDEEAFTGFFL